VPVAMVAMVLEISETVQPVKMLFFQFQSEQLFDQPMARSLLTLMKRVSNLLLLKVVRVV
jgi:hypothetical protein